MKPEITKYKEEDYNQLEKMILALYNEDSNGEEEKVMTVSKIRVSVNRSFSNPEQLQIKILKIDGKVIGYALLTFFWSNEYGGVVVILDELYLLDQYRNKGFATYFITELTKNKDYKAINLEVFKENTKAFNLYQRLGFKVIDRNFMIKVID